MAVTKAQILTATGSGAAGFNNRGIAFDRGENMYFTEEISGTILKRRSGGALSILTTTAAIDAVTGMSPSDPGGTSLALMASCTSADTMRE